MSVSPPGPQDQGGRHAAPRTLPGALDDIEVLDGEVVDDERERARSGRHHDSVGAWRRDDDEDTVIDVEVIASAQPGTPMITTGLAGNRWVKWMRARGTQAAPVSPAPAPARPAPAPARPTPAPTRPAPAPAPTRVAPAPAPARPTPAPARVPPVPRRPPAPARKASAGRPNARGGVGVRDRTAGAVPVGAGRDDRGTPPPSSQDAVPGSSGPAADWRYYLRPGLLVVGALFIQLAFIGIYIGAWHAPVAHGLPVAIVTSAPVEQFQAQVEQMTDGVNARTFTANEDAFAALHDQEVYAVLVDGGGGQLELHLASAAGGSAAESLTQIYGKYALLRGVPLQVYDDVPLPASDNRGITPFYLVVGWVVGGYLVSTLLSFIAGSVPEPRRGRVRILALLAYSVLSGIGGAALVGPVLDIWYHNLVALATIGVLIVFGAAVTSAALSALFSSVGTGLTILLLLALGNAGSGGPFTPELLPGPFRDLHTWLLTGAATTATRSIVYFDGRGDTAAYLVLLTWCAVGSTLYLSAITLRGLRPADAVRFAHYLASRPKP